MAALRRWMTANQRFEGDRWKLERFETSSIKRPCSGPCRAVFYEMMGFKRPKSSFAIGRGGARHKLVSCDISLYPFRRESVVWIPLDEGLSTRVL